MLKRGIILAVFAVILLSALAVISYAKPAGWSGCYDDTDCAWAISSDLNSCLYDGKCDRSWWKWSGSCSYSSTETCSYKVGTKYAGFNGDGYIVVCTSNGCDSIKTKECPSSECKNNLFVSYSYDSYTDSCGESSPVCIDSCCPSGQICTSGKCALPEQKCEDKDRDGYEVPKAGYSASDCGQPTDCDDNDAAVNPGVTEASCDADTVDNDCSGADAPACDSPPPQSCVADRIVSSTEQCDPLVSSGSQVCGDYGTISYGCKSDCTWESVTCSYCGDKTVQLPEQCEPGVSSGSKVCGDGSVVSYGCKSDCTWESVSCPPYCGDEVKQSPDEECDFGSGKNGAGYKINLDFECSDGKKYSALVTCTASCEIEGFECPKAACTSAAWSCTGWSDAAKNCGTRTCTLIDKTCTSPNDVKPSVSQDCKKEPTCIDKVQNGDETGVDCGGSKCPACPVVAGSCTTAASKPSCTLTQGVCAGKTKTCQASTGSWTDCSTSDYGPNYQGVENKCDGLDNDCDGIVDEVGVGFQKAGAACDTSSPVVSNPCSGVELDSSKTCCQSAGFIWAASGEENVDDRTFGGFTQYKQEGCVGDDAGEYIGYRQCRSGICTTDVADFAACNSNRDCVYSAKCYSDVKEIAAAKFGGDISQVWGSQYKERSYHNVNADAKTLEVCDPGFWGGAGGEVGGKVTDVEGKAIANAQVKIIGTAFATATAADGSYGFDGVGAGTYDMVASKSGSSFGDTLKTGNDVPGFGTTTVDFVLTLPKGDCNNDCTKADGFCHSECQGKGQCSFYTEETRSVCDFSVPGIVDYSGKQVLCCKGNLYTPLKANVKIDADNVITRRIPVLRQGKLVNVVITVFNRRA